MPRLLALGCFGLAVFAGPASACINDKELPRHEREFRSNYNRQAPAPPRPAAPPSDYPPIFGGGVALLVVSAGVALVRGRAKG